MTAPARPRVLVDFSLTGHATRFTTRALASERTALHAGDLVTVIGDDVPDRTAEVLHVAADNPEIELQPQGLLPPRAPT